MKIKLSLIGVLLVATQGCWADDAGTLSVGTSVNYSSGKYGAATSTQITSVPLNMAYDQGPWTLKMSVPYVRISGPDNVVVGVGRKSTTTTSIRTASGLGDVVTSATYNFYNNAAQQLGMDITGKVKFGTANAAQGLGTGANDYSVLLDVYKKLGDITVFGGVAYSALGSTGAIQLQNVFGLTAGSVVKVDQKNSVGVSYDYRQKSSATSFPVSEVTAFYAHKFSPAWKSQAYLLKGLADGSPAFGGGVSVGYVF